MRLALSAAFMLIMLALCTLTGCSSGVGQQLLVERDAFNASLVGIHVAHTAGQLTTAQEAKLLPYITAVQSALDAADAAYKAGNTQSATIYLQAAAAGLSKLSTSTVPATSQPSK